MKYGQDDLSNLYTTGDVTVTAVSELAAFLLLIAGLSVCTMERFRSCSGRARALRYYRQREKSDGLRRTASWLRARALRYYRQRERSDGSRRTASWLSPRALRYHKQREKPDGLCRTASWLRIAVVAAAPILMCVPSLASEIALQHGPGGAASLVNTSVDHPVVLLSYSVTRGEGGVELLPEGWDSFQQQEELFYETSATAELLSEAAIADGLLFGPGQSRSIGIPFLLRSDADGDGRINLVDFAIWKSHRKQTLTGPAFGDFNYSGVVDFEDFHILVQEMGNSAAYAFEAATAVPESCALETFGIGLAILFDRRRSRSRKRED